MKTCPKCGIRKPLNDFAVNNRRADGRQSYCKVCKRAIDKAYFEKSWEDKIKPQRKTIEATNKRLANRYQISVEEVMSLQERASGLCEICKEQPGTSIDHCHDTGRVRGILCKPCNLALGLVKDDVDRLRAAVLYLETR